MGWKASCILINERGPGYLGTMPPHDPERARGLIAVLGLGPCHSRGMTTFDEGIYPDHLTIGAYDGAAVIGYPIIYACSSSGDDPLLRRILGRFPQAAILRIALHSVVDLFDYQYFEGGTLLRAYAGSGDRGITMDVGEWLPEERPHFERSVVRDGERYFLADIGGQEVEFDASAYGGTLVFEMIGRFFGCRPDRGHPLIDPMELPMESFAPARRSWCPFRRVYFVEEAHKGRPTSLVCLVCGEKPGGTGLDADALCPACGRMLNWFRGLYEGEEGLDIGMLTAGTRFLDLMADSLDCVEWIIEAEEQFGVVIPDEVFERMKTVGDYLGYIRLHEEKPSEEWPNPPTEGSDPMWDRQVDA